MSAFTIGCLVAIALLLLWRWPVGFALFALVQLCLREVGLVRLVEDGLALESTARLFLLAVLSFVVGYLLQRQLLASRAHRRDERPDDPDDARPPLRPLPDVAVMSVVLVAGGLALYHLVVSGIPLLSPSIETARFDFTSSGLFGVPGRMFLFGTTMSWAAASVNAQVSGLRWRDYRPWRWATGFLVLTTLLGGFKGDVLSLAVTVISLYVLVSGATVTFGEAARRFWWAGALGVGYFAAVAALYPSYSARGGSVWTQLFDRLTISPAQPTQYAIEGYVSFFPGIPVIADFGYFLAKYSGGGSMSDYSFERAVSAAMIGVSPTSDAFTTPVTVGAFAEIVASFGPWIACAAVGLVGAVLAHGEAAPHRTTAGLLGRCLVGLALVSWMAKGGFAYHVVNYSAVATMLVLVGWAAWLVTRGPSPTSSAVVRARRRAY